MIALLITIAQGIGCVVGASVVSVIGHSVLTDDDSIEPLSHPVCDFCGMSSPTVLPNGRVMRCHFCDRELGGLE